ncbi:MAG: hypothetical protein OEW08_09635 [Gammaproteobacteria bacterium]|nr:hypothetical protein [Gammaproteobacteria bacterium]
MNPLLRRRLLLGCSALCCIAGAWVAHAAPSAGIESLRYRQVLYAMYQEHYTQAQVELMAGKDRGDLNSSAEIELLNGVLLYGAGLPELAMQVLPQVLGHADVNSRISDLAWMHYAKAALSIGDQTGFQRGMVSVRDALPGQLEQERLFFRANQLIAEEKLDEAQRLLESMDGAQVWRAYATYNTGVACLLKKSVECGVDAMTSVADLANGTRENTVIRDKARVVLGFWYLQQNDPARALKYLRTVSLDGLYSGKAMLGVGWAYAAQEHYQDALRYWNELSRRDTLDVVTQEGLLASGFAYNKLKSNPLALMHYRQAASTYKDLQEVLDSGMAGLRSGEVLQWLPMSMDDKTLTKELTRLNQTPGKRPILRALGVPAVRDEYRRYRDIVATTSALQEWSEKFALYDEVLDDRVKRQRDRALVLREKVKSIRPDWLEQRFNVAQRTLITSDIAHDGLSFRTDNEERQLLRLQSIYERLSRVPANKLPPNVLERYSVLRGVLMWNIYTQADKRRKDYSEQLAEIEKELQGTKELWRRMELLGNVDQLPVAKLKKRVAQIRERLKAVSLRAHAVKVATGGRFTRQMSAELESERQHVAAYLAQAQYAMARLFDEATASGESQ